MIAVAPPKPLTGKYLAEFKSCIDDYIALLPSQFLWIDQDYKLPSKRREKVFQEALASCQKGFAKLAGRLDKCESLSAQELEEHLERIATKYPQMMHDQFDSCINDFRGLTIQQNEGIESFRQWLMSQLEEISLDKPESAIGCLLLNEAYATRREARGDIYSPLAYRYYVDGLCEYAGEAELVQQQFFSQYEDSNTGRLQARKEYREAIESQIDRLQLRQFFTGRSAEL